MLLRAEVGGILSIATDYELLIDVLEDRKKVKKYALMTYVLVEVEKSIKSVVVKLNDIE